MTSDDLEHQTMGFIRFSISCSGTHFKSKLSQNR